MLNFSLFAAVSSSIMWIIYSFKYIGLQNPAIDSLYQIVVIATLPLLAIWGIFAIVHSLNKEKNLLLRLNYFLELSKKNQDSLLSLNIHSKDISKELKSNFILQQSDILISDINESISEIIKRTNSISSSQIENLWNRAHQGQRWLIAKTFIETYNYQADFINHLKYKLEKDILLKGSVLEFCSRYQNMLSLLEKYDNEKILYNTIEYGALGKIYNILSPIVTEISKNTPSQQQPTQEMNNTKPNNQSDFSDSLFPSFLTSDSYISPIKNEEPTIKETNKAPEIKTTPIAENKPSSETNTINIEEGLRAIRKELTAPSKEQTTKNVPIAPKLTTFTQTQTALRAIRNDRPHHIISVDELEREVNASPDNNYDKNPNPLGAVLNDKKY